MKKPEYLNINGKSFLIISTTNLQHLVDTYNRLINNTLPAAYTFPVQHNHCFGRIILDWLFQDCWYYHLYKNKTAVNQLNVVQLQAAINRMTIWLRDQSVLIMDNNASLQYRNKGRNTFNNSILLFT